ncbi:MAG: hypothetical protein SOX26_01370 [Phocaeicola sp.]|nr:hypothetical protein [Phocaeicola sp.]
MAEYPVGHDVMIAFISRNFRKPTNSKLGTALVNFIIETDGSIRDNEIKNSFIIILFQEQG